MSKLIASSSTLDGITKMISDYHMGSNVTIEQDSVGNYKVFTRKGEITDCKLIHKRGRYRYEAA